MDSPTRKETLVGIFFAVAFLVGLGWVFARFVDNGVSVAATISLFLIILIVFKNHLSPKKYRDALNKLKDDESKK